MRRLTILILSVVIASACNSSQPAWAQLGKCESSVNDTVQNNCSFAFLGGAIPYSQSKTLKGVDFASSRDQLITITNSDFFSVNMVGVDMSEMILYQVSIISSDLSTADLHESRIDLSSLNNSNFTKAEMQGLLINRSRAWGVDFSNSDLTEAKFYGTDFLSAVFAGAILRNATFSQGTIIDNADFTDADLTGAVFESLGSSTGRPPIYCRTTMPDGSMNNEDCGGN